MYKVLQINNVYDYGSTGAITKDLHCALEKEGIRSVVLYGRRQNNTQKDIIKTCTEFEAKAWNVISRFTGRPYAVSPIATKKLITLLEREKPDIVHLQCVNGFFVNIYELLNYLKFAKIPTVITLHAEFMYTGNCGHAFECSQWKSGCTKCDDIKRAIKSKWLKTTHRNWMDMQKAFEGFEKIKICAVSDWVKMRAEESPILNQYPIETVLNGVNTKCFFYNEQMALELRKKNNWLDKKIVLHVTANYKNPEKGGEFVTKLSTMLNPDKYVVIVVDGNNNPPAEGFCGLYWGRAKSAQELAALYSVADVTVITSKRETFSMVCAESLCCGTPVVGFESGGPEMISMKDYSMFCKYGEIKKLHLLLDEMLIKSIDKNVISKEACNLYGSKTMIKKYMSIYKKLKEYDL